MSSGGRGARMASVRRRRSCSCFSLGERLRPLLPGPLHRCAMPRAQYWDTAVILVAPRRPAIAIPCIWSARPRSDLLSAPRAGGDLRAFGRDPLLREHAVQRFAFLGRSRALARR